MRREGEESEETTTHLFTHTDAEDTSGGSRHLGCTGFQAWQLTLPHPLDKKLFVLVFLKSEFARQGQTSFAPLPTESNPGSTHFLAGIWNGETDRLTEAEEEPPRCSPYRGGPKISGRTPWGSDFNLGNFARTF